MPIKPPRPGLPLLLPCALGLWASAAAVYSGMRTAESEHLLIGLALCASAGAIGIVGLVVLARFQGKTALALIASLCIGCALGGACGCGGVIDMRSDAACAANAEGPWACELSTDARQGSYSVTAAATVRNAEGRRIKAQIDLGDCEGLSLEDLTTGTVLQADLSLSAPTEKNAEYLWGQGIAVSAKARSFQVVADEGFHGAIVAVRDRAIGLIAEHGGERAAILAALVCGYRVPLEESGAYEDYKTVGLAHVVAVSGAHLAIVTATLGAALRFLRVPRKAVLAIMAAFVVAYVVFAGVPISAVRAAFMVLLMLAGQAVHRRSASLNALALCIIAFIAVDPTVAVSVSFFLSCGSTMGIVLFAGLFAWWLSFLPEKLRKPVGDPLALTFASNMATLPYSAALFSQVPLIAPFANVAATPLFSFGCVFGLAATMIGCLVPAAAPPLIGAAGMALWPLSAVVSLCAAVPFACLPASLPVVPMIALSALACGVLWAVWPALSLRAIGAGGAVGLLIAAAWLFLLPLLRGPSIVMFDVGQGDSFLIRSEGHALLIDTGNQDAKLREALGRNGVFSLDAVLITHSDDDHCGSLDQLGAVTRIGSVLLARDALACACDSCTSLRAEAAEAAGAQNVLGLSVGDRISVGAFDLQVVWPKSYADEGGNADSLCVLATLDADRDGTVDWRAFFCGDAESEQIEQMVANGSVGDVDVLKVGHHGSRVSLTTELASALDPEIALIGVGANNRYGHPTEEALECLKGAGAETFRTDLNGDVALSFTAERIEVDCMIR